MSDVSSAQSYPATFSPDNPDNLATQELEQIQPSAFSAGVKACSPTLIGIAAWGLVVGIAMIKTHFTIVQALGMTLFVFAGSAQLAALPLIALGAPLWVIFVTALAVNLRFVIFSVMLAPHFSHLNFKQKAFWGYMTGDVSMAFFVARYPSEEPQAGKFDFMKGLFIPNWIAWQIGSISGIFLGSQIPEDWGVGFAGSLAILCILLPMVMNRAILVGVLVAGGIALATLNWPYKLGMLLAVLVGMISSMAWEEWQERLNGNSAVTLQNKEKQ